MESEFLNEETVNRTEMSNPFSSFNWLTRDADYPRRRLLTILNASAQGLPSELVVDVTRYDGNNTMGGEVRQEGTPINASKFNNLEGRIGQAFSQIITYINDDAENKFEILFNDKEGIHEELNEIQTAIEPIEGMKSAIEDELNPNTFILSENIDVGNNIFNGILDKINTGVYGLSFFIPYNKSAAKVASAHVEGAFKVYTHQGALSENFITINTETLRDIQYELKPLGLVVNLIVADLLSTEADDCSCSVKLSQDSVVVFSIEEEETDS